MNANAANRRGFLGRCAGLVAGTFTASAADPGPAQDNADARPNVIWIMGDQHRAQALGCMGDANLKTPHLDRLAGAGTSAVAGCPLCTPFRGSLLTSRYPHECCTGHDLALPDGLPTVASAFGDAGYHTAYFGKWHVDGRVNLGEAKRSGHQFVRPERRGDFDLWLGYENNNAPRDCWLHGHKAKGEPVDLFKLPKYETDAMADLVVDYVRERATGRGQPFFAVLSVQPPHSPYKAPEEWMARHRPEEIVLRPNVPNVARVEKQARRDLAGYYANIENLDANVGRVMEALEAEGLDKNTYIVYFSDHGDMHGSHGRLWKCVPWEESIRVPFIVAKGNQPCGPAAKQPHPTLINHVDIAPTTLGLCGIAKPDWMRGTDYAAAFSADKAARTKAPFPDSAYLQLVDPGYEFGFASDRERPWRGIVTADGWKYAALEGQPWLMYHLEEDPYELVNLALDGRFRAQRKKLQDRLAGWIADTGDSFNLPELWT